jgi:DNA-binding SARP family transcriptional activator
MYDFRLLGPGQAYYDGKLITGFPGQQYCLLFYYLLLNRQIPHTREQVATIFWNDSSAAIARKNLRNSLWRLSQSFQSSGASLEDLIAIHEDYLTFVDTDTYELDIDQIDAASRCSLDQANQELSVDQILLLETAVELYKGDLLEGIYEDWCLYERERLRLAFLNILIRLMDHHSSKGNYAQGLEYGKRLLTLDPTRESVHRQIMMIHWLAGNREAALLQYRSCCDVLQTELGLKPVQETQHLYETIKRSPAAPERRTQNNQENINGHASLPTNPSLNEMVQKLHFLEMIVEQTNTELHILERMMQQVLGTK